MDIEIIYCHSWGYKPQAARAAEEIQRKYPEAEVECVPTSGGIFKIVVDGKVIFDKNDTGRYPENGEILRLME